MIKSNELRIGNKILFNNFIEPQKIVTIDARFFSSLAGGRNGIELKPDEEISNYYSPIPLTPEIIDKLGFNGGILKTATSFSEIAMAGDDSVYLMFEGCSDNEDLPIKYVHQLQNLYFALTGEELMIEDLNDERSVATKSNSSNSVD